MVPERTQSVSPQHDGYLRNRLFAKRRRRTLNQPINAIALDFVDLSGEEPDRVGEYKWLSAMVTAMPEKEVARRMKKHRDSYPTIDDALVEKLIMEAL